MSKARGFAPHLDKACTLDLKKRKAQALKQNYAQSGHFFIGLVDDLLNLGFIQF